MNQLLPEDERESATLTARLHIIANFLMEQMGQTGTPNAAAALRLLARVGRRGDVVQLRAMYADALEVSRFLSETDQRTLHGLLEAHPFTG